MPCHPALRALPPLLLALPAAAQPVPRLAPQPVPTTALLQAVAAVSADTAWLSGHRGAVLRTTDGGARWELRPVPGADSLQFRDVEARDGRRAVLLSIGYGPASRVYTTEDGGTGWTLRFTNPDTAAFYDCLAQWPSGAGFAWSDAVGEVLPVVASADGITWAPASHLLPAAQPGEGGFAASGTCALAWGARHAWIGTGNAPVARVFRTDDGGRSWSAATAPLVAATGAGIASLAFRDSLVGVALGGTIGGSATGPRAARTRDGGRTWQVIAEPSFAGAVYGAAYAPTPAGWALVAVGPGGASWSADDGDHWQPLDEGAYWGVGFGPTGRGWMVGPRGRVTRVDWDRRD